MVSGDSVNMKLLVALPRVSIYRSLDIAGKQASFFHDTKNSYPDRHDCCRFEGTVELIAAVV